ncbi:MAG: hypothetical protein EOP39_09500, partial [Rubrivivax sp.]
MIYLMDFDPKHRCLHRMRVFDDQQRLLAQEERLRLELLHLQAGEQREVILLAAADEATLRHT